MNQLSPSRLGAAFRARLPQASGFRPKAGGNKVYQLRRHVGLGAAVVAVVAAGTASAMFVDYLADRAIERSASLTRLEALLTQDTAAPASPTALPGAPADRSPSVAARPAKSGSVARLPSAQRASDPSTDGEEIIAYDSIDDVANDPSVPVSNASYEGARDDTFTAGIPLPAGKPTPAEPSAPKLAEDRDTRVAVPEKAVSDDADADAQAARVTKDVNLRSKPTNKGGVVAVIPAKASVSLVGCKAWCEILFEGKRGWVYKDFVRKS